MPFNGLFHTPPLIIIIIIIIIIITIIIIIIIIIIIKYTMQFKSRSFSFESGFTCSYQHELVC